MPARAKWRGILSARAGVYGIRYRIDLSYFEQAGGETVQCFGLLRVKITSRWPSCGSEFLS